jgi:hypothetical protein
MNAHIKKAIMKTAPVRAKISGYVFLYSSSFYLSMPDYLQVIVKAV